MDEDGIIVICSKENTAHTEGSESKCKKCQVKVWVSNSTLNALKMQRKELTDQQIKDSALCTDCGLAEMAKLKDPSLIKPTEEQIQEIVAGIRKNAK